MLPLKANRAILVLRGMRNPLAELWYEAQSAVSQPDPVVEVEPVVAVELVVDVEPPEAHRDIQSDTQRAAVGAEVSPPSTVNDINIIIPLDAAPALSVPTPANASAAAQQSTGVLTPVGETEASQTVAPILGASADTSTIDLIYPSDVPVPSAAEVSIKKLFTASYPSVDIPIQDKYGPVPCEELEIPRGTQEESVALHCGKACARYEDCRAFWCAPSLSALTV